MTASCDYAGEEKMQDLRIGGSARAKRDGQLFNPKQGSNPFALLRQPARAF
jgi:hypothetical protein